MGGNHILESVNEAGNQMPTAAISKKNIVAASPVATTTPSKLLVVIKTISFTTLSLLHALRNC